MVAQQLITFHLSLMIEEEEVNICFSGEDTMVRHDVC